RTEQVLKRMMSASSGVLVSSRAWSPRSTSTILSESYSFIWQPNVRMYSLRAPGRAGEGEAAAVVEGAAAEAPARLIEVSCMAFAVTGVDPGGVVSNGEAPILARRCKHDLVRTQLAITMSARARRPPPGSMCRPVTGASGLPCVSTASCHEPACLRNPFLPLHRRRALLRRDHVAGWRLPSVSRWCCS